MLDALFEEVFTLVVSDAVINELVDVLGRPRIQRRLSSTRTPTRLFAHLESRAFNVRLTGALQLCRDPKDDMILETAILGEAQYVVSRDDDIKRDLDLIVHLRDNGVEVVSVAQFLALLGAD